MWVKSQESPSSSTSRARCTNEEHYIFKIEQDSCGRWIMLLCIGVGMEQNWNELKVSGLFWVAVGKLWILGQSEENALVKYFQDGMGKKFVGIRQDRNPLKWDTQIVSYLRVLQKEDLYSSHKCSMGFTWTKNNLVNWCRKRNVKDIHFWAFTCILLCACVPGITHVVEA